MPDMIRKESLQDDSIRPLNNMDKYLINQALPLSVMPKMFNQSPTMPHANQLGNMYVTTNKQTESPMNQYMMSSNIQNNLPLNQNNLYNRLPLNANNVDTKALDVKQLYSIADSYPMDKLTLSVNNGNLKGPFCLPRDQTASMVDFILTEDSLSQIKSRDDLDIVLLSRLTNAGLNMLMWPASLKLFVNEVELRLDANIISKVPLHSPQFIKNFCVVGRNIVRFEIADLTKIGNAVFQFHIYMVHRPTIQHAKKLTLENAFRSDELTFKLLHECCAQNQPESTLLSLVCPISRKRIEIPIRFRDCNHLQPFDLVGFLKFQARWLLNVCPVCSKAMHFNFNGHQKNIVVDSILQNIFDGIPLGIQLVQMAKNGSVSLMPHTVPINNGMVLPHPSMPHMNEVNHMSNSIVMQQSMPMYRSIIMNQSVSPQFMNGGQPPPGIPYRFQNPPISNVNIDSRSMLDLRPMDELPGMIPTQQLCQSFPATHNCLGENPLPKRPVKRKTPKKATLKTKYDLNSNTINNNNTSSNCPTPPSTRTSSVASTSSPDSLNVPQSNLKRPNSNDILSSTMLSESNFLGNDDNSVSSAATSSIPQPIMSFNHHQPFQSSSSHDMKIPVCNWEPSSDYTLPSCLTISSASVTSISDTFNQSRNSFTQITSLESDPVQYQVKSDPQMVNGPTDNHVINVISTLNCSNNNSSNNCNSNNCNSNSINLDNVMSPTLKNFLDHILDSYDHVSEPDQYPWLNCYNLLSIEQPISNLSDLEEDI